MTKKTPQISIIIPVYNIEKYIANCVQSVLQQTYLNIEIILVNDGATDSSGLICDKFAAQDSRIKVIHKINGGLSDARNVGTEHAKGDYIYYLDGDDYIENTCIETLVENALKFDADIVQGSFYYHYPTYYMFDTRIVEPQLMEREQAMEELLRQDRVKNFAWGKLYKKAIVQSIPFKKGAYFEDSFWQYKVIHNIKKYVIIPNRLYYYNQREDSISATFSIKNIDLIKGTFERLIFIKELYPKLYPLAVIQFEKLFFQGLNMARKTNKKDKKTIFKLICKIPLAASYQFKNKLLYFIFIHLPLGIPIIDFVQRALNKLSLSKSKNHYKKTPIKND